MTSTNHDWYFYTQFSALRMFQDFEESNLMHSMNGFVYGNLPGLEMSEGDTVRWHLAAYGTEVNLALLMIRRLPVMHPPARNPLR